MAGRFQFASNLYLGEGIASEKLDKIKRRLEKKPLLANVYPGTRRISWIFSMRDSWSSRIIRMKNF